MCATTGLRHGGFALGVDGRPFTPLDEREVSAEIATWAEQTTGVMNITGRNARNLNPIVKAGDDGRELEFAWWWIWRDSSGPVNYSAFNARAERLSHSWAGEFQHRALIPASWYVEKGVRFEHPSQHTLGIAAVTSRVIESDGNELLTYSLVTREAIGGAAKVHDRMPLILPPDQHDAWLDPHRTGDKELATAALTWSEPLSLAMNPVRSHSTPTLF